VGDEAGELRKRFGEDLRKAREKANLSQDEVAERVGVTQAYVSYVEAGMRNITINRMNAFAEALGFEMIISFRPSRRQP
jgi:transcriptional regulator with XRE-family HTH domain